MLNNIPSYLESEFLGTQSFSGSPHFSFSKTTGTLGTSSHGESPSCIARAYKNGLKVDPT